ncbi:hypothetical protein Zmor_027069 [Zophobas morio]|uniref:Uncharacterized protein n=1 Tax=Zophobas morio TaxID=2755281 RepID=A0AA38HJP4_9CUCU|nr:hypothetical protein Zmor_027069 [Zophobas morio]
MDSTSPTLYLNFTEVCRPQFYGRQAFIVLCWLQGVLKLLGMVVYTKNNFISFQATRSKGNTPPRAARSVTHMTLGCYLCKSCCVRTLFRNSWSFPRQCG